MAVSLVRWVCGDSGRKRSARTLRRSFRPRLDVLEDRTLPSIFTVTNLEDGGAGSLRQAMLDASRACEHNTILFAVAGTIDLASPLPDLDTNTNILGPGPDRLTVERSTADGTPPFSVFTIHDATVTLSRLTIANGSATFGGGILNDGGALTIRDCILTRNSALRGGGIINFGSLTVSHSTLTDNGATSKGGGIANFGPLTVTYSRLTGNSSSSGGGIYNFAGAMLTVRYSTLADNSADFGGGIDINGGMVVVASSTLAGNSALFGGGILNSFSGILTVSNSTLAGNSALYEGGGIQNNDGGTLTVRNATISGNWAAQGGGICADGRVACRDSIFAGNTAADGPDVCGSVRSQGHNLIGDTNGCEGFDPSDLVNLDPLLGPLQDNGGPTLTMALLPASPAIDAGDNSEAPVWDQRGHGFRRIVNGRIDIGAFEVQVAGDSRLAASSRGGLIVEEAAILASINHQELVLR